MDQREPHAPAHDRPEGGLQLPLAFVLAATLLTTGAGSDAGAATTHVVCAAGSAPAGCNFTGNGGIQAAVDAARDSDTVLIKAGVYAPEAFRDVTYQQYTIRGFVVLERKRLTMRGEPGTILDGSTLNPASAIVVNGGEIDLAALSIRGFRAAVAEDDLYDGHGVFIIDATAVVRDVTIERYQKMALTGRGSSKISASGLTIRDGHVAIWLEELAHLRLCNSVVSNNDSAGIAAYGNSTASVYDSVFDGNQDDGLYAANDAVISASNTLLLRNKPYAVRAIDNARVLFGSERDANVRAPHETNHHGCKLPDHT